MKICPICKTVFPDDLNYCLHDGTTLRDEKLFDPEETISATVKPTLEYKGKLTAEQHKDSNLSPFERSSKAVPGSNRLPIFAGIFGLFFLVAAAMGGGYFYFKSERERGDGIWSPPPEERLTPLRTPTPTPTPQSNLKVEILGQVKNNRGDKFLKCRLTNTGITVARPFWVLVTLYNNDVKLRDASAKVPLEFLKPGQSIPVWISLYVNDKYTALKNEEVRAPYPVRKTADELFPELVFQETAMKPQYTTSYKVEGIVQNEKYETISPNLYVLYLDDKSEIIGIKDTRISNLKRGEKAKFEVSAGDMDLFGKPKSFEIIAVDN